MKKLVIILILGMSVTIGAFAQGNFDNNPRVQKLRKEFYNTELQFTDAEAKAFWPLFEQYQRENRKLRKEYKMDANPTLLNNTEAEERIKKSFEHDEKKNEIKKKYFDKFSKVLPVRKVALLESTERKFKKSVLKKVRQNRQRRNK